MKLPQKKRVVNTFIALLTTVLMIGLFTGSSLQTPVAEAKTVTDEILYESQIGVTDELNLIRMESLQHEVLAAHASEVGMVNVGVATSTNTVAAPPPLDRTKPIYTVYKNGCLINVPVEWQWYIRDMAEKYGFAEKYIYGCILAESGFNTNCKGDGEKSLGLAQIQKYWIRGANINHFTEDYRNRNLLDPYDNILTLMEIWTYARDAYGINTSTEQGMKDLMYWHNTGKYRSNVNWKYSNNVCQYANELVKLQ